MGWGVVVGGVGVVLVELRCWRSVGGVDYVF